MTDGIYGCHKNYGNKWPKWQGIGQCIEQKNGTKEDINEQEEFDARLNVRRLEYGKKITVRVGQLGKIEM
jgi:Na+/citrate or Na+/malate symporter